MLKSWYDNLDDGKACPFLKTKCIGRKCALYVELQGKRPQDGRDIREWGCAHAWLPMLLIENARTNRETSAELSALRSENVTAAAQLAGALTNVASSMKRAPLTTTPSPQALPDGGGGE